jgi:predicted dehydrogenase
MASPIRVGLIGLSASATGTGWATSAHLPYLQKSPHYKITALCNSSVENAKAAVAAYNLGPETKTYGSAADLAADPDVDLVVVSTRVDRHGGVALPSVRAGKAVFCEWPLEGSLEKATEMVEAAKRAGGKTMVGAQGGMNPTVAKMKSLIDEGAIGRVLSSTVVAAVNNGGAEESSQIEYFMDRKVGGNLMTIGFGHCESTPGLPSPLLFSKFCSI